MFSSRSHQRRRVYLTEAIALSDTLQVIDLSRGGFGAVVTAGPVPAVGDTVELSGARAIVRHSGRLRSGGRILPRLGLELSAPEPGCAGFLVPAALPVFATAPSPWFHRERTHLRVTSVGAGGMTYEGGDFLPAGVRLELTIHLPLVGVETVAGRVSAHGVVDWIEPSRGFLKAVAAYLLHADDTLTPAALRAAGLAVGSVEHAIAYDAASSDEFDEILALRLKAHQAIGHLEDATVDDMRSPYDSHSRHLVCRFGERIVGYLRVIFVDGAPERSQYVSMGGHQVPQWLWDAGFVEGGAGAMDPEFQKAGIYLGMMSHLTRVAVQSGVRYILGACPDELLEMYAEQGYELLETREVEPKPGWRFRSHLICQDIERVVSGAVRGRAVRDMAEAAQFAGFLSFPAFIPKAA